MENVCKPGKGVITSNHAALRRFFPLSCGDAVVHTWDVLHGVDVEEGIDRTSLIVWFTEKSQDETAIAPWLQDHPKLESDNVAQFVLASALESSNHSPTKVASQASQSMHQEVQNNHDNRQHKPQGSVLQAAIELYLSSAERGNSFAMTRLGSLAEAGRLDQSTRLRAQEVLDALRPNPSSRPELVDSSADNYSMVIAHRFWYEASVRGNALAQVALADEIMLSASHDPEARLLAATLFGLAAQQGSEQAVESLTRLVEMDVEYNGVSCQEEFEALPVVQTAQVATKHL